jgi:hypothetical protein
MIKQLCAGTLAMFISVGLAHAAESDCEKQAAEKKLTGMAKMSFVAKCQAKVSGTGAAKECAKQAKDKGLAGAAKASFVEKCAKEGASASE